MAARQTIIAHLNSELKKLNEREYNEYTAIEIDISGQFVPYTNTNYIDSATTVKSAAFKIDEQLFSVTTTYAPTSYVNEQISSVIGGAPSTLDTLAEIAAAINNDASFAVNFISTIVVEQIFATNAENKLTLDLSGEIVRATTVELDIQQDISGEIQRAEGAESTIRYDLSGEIQRATGYESQVYDSYLSTVTDRVTLIGDFSNTFSNLSLSLNTFFTSSLQGEEGRAQAAELQLRKDVSGETIRETAAELKLAQDLSGENLRALAAELKLAEDLSSETTRATGAEDALSLRVSQIEEAYIKKDGSVAMTSILDLSGNAILNVTPSVNSADLQNKGNVNDSINTLGAPFRDAGDFNVISDNIENLSNTPGSTYSISGVITTSYSLLTNGVIKYVKNGDKIVRRADGAWDVLNNTDILISGTTDKVQVTGDGYIGYTANISSTYPGQESITTVGTVTTGTWQGSVINTNKGATSFSSYAQGDLITGSSSTLQKYSINFADTMLAADGNQISWIPVNTINHSITNTSNFSGKQNLQEALDFLYTQFQQRHIVQFVEQSILSYVNPTIYNPELLSGKVNFINPQGSATGIYLPPSNTVLEDGTIVRLVHNGDYSEDNWKVYYRNVDTSEDVEVLEIAPHETTAFIWNAASSSWMVGIGI